MDCFPSGGEFTAKRCCAGGGGDPTCWEGKFTFARCCGGSGSGSAAIGSATPNSFELEFRCTCDDAVHGSCGAHGKCRDGVCECTDGYQLHEGLCEDASCAGVDCSGHGTCHGSGSQARGMCECEAGWVGLDCATSNPCEGVHCEHGHCDPASGVCDCDARWVGESCSEPDPCYGVSCSHGGTCVDGHCVCTPGRLGERCMQDCATSIPSLRVSGPSFRFSQRTGVYDLVVQAESKEIPATGCDPLTDLCLRDDCPSLPSGVPVCHPSGLEFSCEVDGVLYDDCSCADACTDVYCAHGGTCVQGRCVCTPGYSGPECMHDCATPIPGKRMSIRGSNIVSSFGSTEIRASGCTAQTDLCFLEHCPAPVDLEGNPIPVCRIGGPEFICTVSGELRNDCTCVPPLYPCTPDMLCGQSECPGWPARGSDGRPLKCNVRPAPRTRPVVHFAQTVRTRWQGHGTEIDRGMHGCTCDPGWSGACCTEETNNALSGGGH